MNTRTSAFLSAIACLCCLGTAQDRQEVKSGRIVFDPARGELAVSGQGMPLSLLLQSLAAEHGVRVTVVDFHDRNVDVEFGPRPLAEALAQLLGKDARYHLDFATRDVVVAPRSTALQVGPVAAPAKAGRPMDTAPQLIPGLPVMTVQPRRAGAGAVMQAAEMIAPQAGDATGAAAPAPQGPQETHACIVLLLRADGTATVDRILELDGPAVANTALQGDCIYEVEIGGQTFAVGSLQDPLANHCVCNERPADPRRRMTRTEDPVARVVLTVDRQLLAPGNLPQAAVRLHKVTDGRGLPPVLTADTLPVFKQKAVPMFAVDGRALATARIERK